MSRIKFMKAVNRFTQNDDGAAMLEFALILPALAMLIFGIMEISRAMWLENALSYSVEQAARCASIDKITCGTNSQIQAYAGNQSGIGFSASTFTIAVASCGIDVSGSAPIHLSIPFLAPSITLSAHFCYPA